MENINLGEVDKNKMLQFTAPFLGSLLGEEKGSMGELINGFVKQEIKILLVC